MFSKSKLPSFIGIRSKSGVLRSGIELRISSDGRVTSQATVVGIGISSDGERRVLGIDVGPSEDRAFWTSGSRTSGST
jgi:transposase-like protein